jgi:hypothetical protein
VENLWLGLLKEIDIVSVEFLLIPLEQADLVSSEKKSHKMCRS